MSARARLPGDINPLSRSSAGFIRLNRSSKSFDLLRSDPLAFALLCLISLRARWSDAQLNPQDLSPGEALIGDYWSAGLTRQQQRTRITRLVRWGFITVKSTNRGTIATLIDSDVFDIFPRLSTTESTSQQPTANLLTTSGQPLNKKENKENKNEIHGAETLDLFAQKTGQNTGTPQKSRNAKQTDEQFLESLKSNPAYRHINLEAEMGRMDAWILTHPNRQKTRRFIVNWLNRIEVPLTAALPEKTTPNKTKNGW